MRLLLGVFVALLATATCSYAQDGTTGDPLLKNLLSKGLSSAKSATGGATHFKPSGARLILDSYVKTITEDGAERKALGESLGQLIAAYETAAKSGGFANDVAAATTFAMAQYWTLWKGAEVSDKASDALLKQMRGALETPEMRKLSDSEKQKLYEATLLGVMSLVLSRAVAEEQKDAATKAGIAKAARTQLESMLGVDPEAVRLTDKGLEAAKPAVATAGSPPATAATSASIDSVLASYALPSGWEKKTYPDGTVTAGAMIDDGQGRRHDCEIRIMPPRAAPNGAAKAFQQLWKESLAGFNAGEVSIAYRRVFPCGAVAHYMGGFYKLKKNDSPMYVALYVLDLGDRVLPFAASVVPGRAQLDYNPNWSALETNVKYLGPFIDSLKLKKTPPVPAALFSRAEVEGYWTESSSSMVVGGYYVTSSGDYAGAMMSAHGLVLHLNPDRSFYYRFAYANRGAREIGQDKNEGTYTKSGDILKLNPKHARSFKYEYRVVGAGFIQTDKGNKRALVLRGPDSKGNYALPPYFPNGKEWEGSVSWLTETTKDRK